MSDDQRGSGPGGDPSGGQPNPFSREGSGDNDALGASQQPAPEESAPAAPADPVPEPPAAASWPTYPPVEPQQFDPRSGSGPASYPSTPYQPPYAPPSANPVGQQPPPPSFDAQPTGPYGAPDANPGYPPPPAAPYAPAPGYGSNPYEVNPYQPSYGGYSPYGMPAGPHPKSNPALIFGIVGLVLALSCGVGGLVGIGGIINGRTAKAEIDADPQRYTGRSTASAGFGLGVAAVVIAVVVIVIFLIALASGALNS
jgi:hypothetical protein